MARYTGPTSKIARKFREPIFGPDKALEKKNYPPGQHGVGKKRAKQSEYAIQLQEKQKAKYTYGILERQFAKIFDRASRSHATAFSPPLRAVFHRNSRLQSLPEREGGRTK